MPAFSRAGCASFMRVDLRLDPRREHESLLTRRADLGVTLGVGLERLEQEIRPTGQEYPEPVGLEVLGVAIEDGDLCLAKGRPSPLAAMLVAFGARGGRPGGTRHGATALGLRDDW
jgi:hypothetical protein